MKLKNLYKFKTYTTFVYLIPLFLALHFNVLITAIPLSVLIVICFYYHISEEQKFSKLDTFFAYCVIITNIVICALSGFAQPYFSLVLFSVIVSIYFYFSTSLSKNYNRNHGLWHIFTSFITIFSILTYISN